MIAGLALAGGESRRMGADKPLLPLGGKPLIAHVLDRLRTETGAVAISANGDPARYAGFAVPVLPDGTFAGRGPLAGVLAGLHWAAMLGADALLTISADTPFAPAELAKALTPAPACAASLGRTHYLVALWPMHSADALRDILSGPGPFAARRFGALIGIRVVPFPTAAGNDPFWNVNTPADLRTAAPAQAPPTP